MTPRWPQVIRKRRGASLVQTAITTTVFMMLVLGTIDLGLAVFRQQLISHLARRAARMAIVHGDLAPSGWYGGSWGTSSTTVQGNATGSGIVQALAATNAFSGLNPAQTTIKIDWLDGTTDPEIEQNRLRVTVTATYKPLITFIFGSPTWTFTAASTMNVAH